MTSSRLQVGLLDGAIAFGAIWTIGYHLGLAVNVAAMTIAVPTIAIGFVAAAVAMRTPEAPTSVSAAQTAMSAARFGVAGFAGLGLAGIGVAITAFGPFEGLEWWFVWSCMLGGMAIALVDSSGRLDRRDVVEPLATDGDSQAAKIALICAALLLALGALIVNRPDGDDIFVVNASVAVATLDGPFVDVDTIFSDPASAEAAGTPTFRSSRPDVVASSWEALLGTIARLGGIAPLTVVYLWVPPVVALAIAASLHRLLGALGARRPAWSAVAAVAFLAADGEMHTSFGNFSFARAWQGKVVFVAVVVPLLWTYALALGRKFSMRSFALLSAAMIASIGLTSTAFGVGPAIVVLGVAAGWWCSAERDVRTLVGGGVALVYPAMALVLSADLSSFIAFGGLHLGTAGSGTLAFARGVVPALLGQAPESGEPGRFVASAPWYTVFGSGLSMVLAGAAFVAGWATLRDRTARVAMAGASLVLLASFLGPGMGRLGSYVSVESIIWRVMWIVPIPALVGAGVVGMATMAARFGMRGWLPIRMVPVTAGVLAAIVLTMSAASGRTVLAADNAEVTIGTPTWKLVEADRAAAEPLLDAAAPGDIILAPEKISAAVAMQSATIHAVNPRSKHLQARWSDEPAFMASGRKLATDAVTTGLGPDNLTVFAELLDALSVDLVCTAPLVDGSPVTEALLASGFEAFDSGDDCTYWRLANG